MCVICGPRPQMTCAHRRERRCAGTFHGRGRAAPSRVPTPDKLHIKKRPPKRAAASLIIPSSRSPVGSAEIRLSPQGARRVLRAPSVSTRWENRDQVEPSASVPVRCGGSLRVLARYSRGFLKGTGGSPLERTFGSFSSARKGTRGARRNAPVILAAHGRQFP